jgi:hypothetical protein
MVRVKIPTSGNISQKWGTLNATARWDPLRFLGYRNGCSGIGPRQVQLAAKVSF